MQQEVLIFDNIFYIRDEMTMTLLDDFFFSNKLKYKILKFPQNKNYDFVNYVSNFEQNILNIFENKAFLGKMGLCQTFIYFYIQLESN